jgi:arylformamidase
MLGPEALADRVFSDYRIVDLSLQVRPGVEKIDGSYHWGNQIRKFQIRQFIAPGPHFMYWVDAETHVGTHVELPAHIIDGARSATEMPLETFMGKAIVYDFGFLEPSEDGRAWILPEHLANVKPGDIVLMWSSRTGRSPAISLEAGKLLAKLPIKMLGIANVSAPDDVHHVLLGKEESPIPIIEQLAHLDQLERERVFFIGLPLRVAELDSSWIRALALEPLP